MLPFFRHMNTLTNSVGIELFCWFIHYNLFTLTILDKKKPNQLLMGYPRFS
jgi:hypothetical protein